MSDIIIAILAVIFVLGVAINIHELGHFLFAKLFGMRVEAYSFFGLGPRVFGFKVGHTDYRVSAIPLGAYVKLYGDDGAGPLEAKDATAEPVPESELYELRPRWQKFFVMIGGPLMNFVLAFFIPFGIALVSGVPANPSPIVGRVQPGGAAEVAGLKPGDRIVKVNGIDNPSWGRITDEALLMPERPVPFVIERDGQRIDISVTPSRVSASGQSAGILEMAPDPGAVPVVVGQIDPSMPAASSGLQRGDWILAVNGTTLRNPNDMVDIITKSNGAPIELQVDRGGQRVGVTITPVDRGSGWRVGVGFDESLLSVKEPVGIGGAASFALEQNLRILRVTGAALFQVGTGERSARDTVSGPIGIVQAIVNQVRIAGFDGLLLILMAISLSLGVMNLLPIPMLDGGQIMVLGIEKLLSWFGRTLSLAARERIQLTGLAIVLLLMVTVTFLDVSRLFGK